MIQTKRPTLSTIEATSELSQFLLVKSTTSDLLKLLESRADPNMPVKPGNISPLQKVMTSAREKKFSEMRNLLLQHGANEADQEQSLWELRQRADFCERMHISSYTNIDKDYDPLFD